MTASRTRRTRTTLLPLGLLLLHLLCVQGASAAAPRTEDVTSIDGILGAYYEVVSGPAGAAPDVARDRSLHHPDAWIAIAGRSEAGRPEVQRMDLDGYHGDGGPRSEGFWERETGRSVQRSGNMIHVWSAYASSRTENGPPFATGVNSITLFDDGERLWIMGWMFDQAAGAGE